MYVTFREKSNRDNFLAAEQRAQSCENATHTTTTDLDKAAAFRTSSLKDGALVLEPVLGKIDPKSLWSDRWEAVGIEIGLK